MYVCILCLSLHLVTGRGVDLNRNWSVDWGKKEKVNHACSFDASLIFLFMLYRIYHVACLFHLLIVFLRWTLFTIYSSARNI